MQQKQNGSNFLRPPADTFYVDRFGQMGDRQFFSRTFYYAELENFDFVSGIAVNSLLRKLALLPEAFVFRCDFLRLFRMSPTVSVAVIGNNAPSHENIELGISVLAVFSRPAV